MAIFKTLTGTAQRRITAAGRALDRARSIYREKGSRELLSSVSSFLGRKIGMHVGQRAQYLRQRASIDQQFDTRCGTDTGGVQNLYSLTIAGDNALHGGTHIAVDPAEFADGLQALAVNPSDFTFLDLGSGKGRALFLAAECGFPQVIGVEFAMELHQVATANLAAVAAVHPEIARRIQLIHADATTVAIPSGPVVVFLFNPFDAVICRHVARNLLDSWKTAPRPIRIFYMNPVELNTWLQEGWHILHRAQPYALLHPPASC